MFRALLPVALIACAGSAPAQTLSVPGLDGQSPAPSACSNIPYSQDNCVRVLACIGDAGLWFDGEALGWNQGAVRGRISDGSGCTGKWRSDGPMGTGLATLECDSGLAADVVYTTQDNETGTVSGIGRDNSGRAIRVWSGENVLDFLTPRGSVGAELPCEAGPIPIS